MSSRSNRIERKIELDHPAGKVVFRLPIDGLIEGYDERAREKFADSVLNHMTQNFGLTASVYSHGERQSDSKTRSYPIEVRIGDAIATPTVEFTDWPTSDRDLFRFAYGEIMGSTTTFIGLTIGHGPSADYLEQADVRTQATSLQARQTLNLISPEMSIDGQHASTRRMQHTS